MDCCCACSHARRIVRKQPNGAAQSSATLATDGAAAHASHVLHRPGLKALPRKWTSEVGQHWIGGSVTHAIKRTSNASKLQLHGCTGTTGCRRHVRPRDPSLRRLVPHLQAATRIGLLLHAGPEATRVPKLPDDTNTRRAKHRD